MFFGETRKQYQDNDPRYYIWLQLKSNAKSRKIPFDIMAEDIIIPEYCPVLGTKLMFGRGERGKRKNTPSVDRVDNSRGYTKDNIRVISFEANRLKDANTIETLERLLAYMKGTI